jgi:hypothetical protein
MISLQARDGFDRLLTKAIKASLLPSAQDSCDVSVLTDLADITETRIVMLTVSSYLFRLMVMIYFTPDTATRAHFARIHDVEADAMSDQAFQDAIAECGNLCCGILNRDLGEFFPHIGLSTPNIIDRHCASYIDALHCGHVQHFRVNVNAHDTPPFHVSLCVSEYADLDFVVTENEESADTGELELF